MKICFTVDTMQCGGTERVVSILANSFISRGHEVTILIISSPYANSYYNLDKRIKLKTLFEKGEKPAKYLKKVELLSKKISSINPNIVLSFLTHVNIYSYFACKKNGTPIIVSERSNPITYSFVRKALLKYVFFHANGCVFQTRDVSKFYRRKKKLASGKIIFNPCCFDKSVINLNRNNKVIVSVGRLIKSKNYGLLIKSFASFLLTNPEYCLHIYGEGSEKQHILSLIQNLNLSNNVFLMGNDLNWITSERESELFVLSSNFEGMPNSLIEALCSGMKCISTDCPVGAPKELKERTNNLFLCKCNDEESMVNALKLGISCKADKTYENISREVNVENITSQWLKYITDIIKGE